MSLTVPSATLQAERVRNDSYGHKRKPLAMLRRARAYMTSREASPSWRAVARWEGLAPHGRVFFTLALKGINYDCRKQSESENLALTPGCSKANVRQSSPSWAQRRRWATHMLPLRLSVAGAHLEDVERSQLCVTLRRNTEVCSVE